MSNRIIIGIHGLGRKPPEANYADNWRRAMADGLRRNLGYTGPPPAFRLVYWGLWNSAETWPDETYLSGDGEGPYPAYEDRWLDQVVGGVLATGGDALDLAKSYLGLDALGDAFLRASLEDLGTYYDDAAKRAALRKRLDDELVRHAGKRIMLVAHSMGSIVAYDVLRELGRARPGFEIEHLVTIGSPLGLPHVILKLGREWGRPRVPTVVRRWTNLAERRDPIAFDAHLRDNFALNDRFVGVDDHLVINSSPGRPGIWRYHAVFGYLRTPELSRHLLDFI